MSPESADEPEDDRVCFYCGYPDCRCDDEDDEDETANCSGYFSEHDGGRFICGAVGSEDCDWCSCYDWLGKTAEEVEQEELDEMEKRTP